MPPLISSCFYILTAFVAAAAAFAPTPTPREWAWKWIGATKARYIRYKPDGSLPPATCHQRHPAACDQRHPATCQTDKSKADESGGKYETFAEACSALPRVLVSDWSCPRVTPSGSVHVLHRRDPSTCHRCASSSRRAAYRAASSSPHTSASTSCCGLRRTRDTRHLRRARRAVVGALLLWWRRCCCFKARFVGEGQCALLLSWRCRCSCTVVVAQALRGDEFLMCEPLPSPCADSNDDDGVVNPGSQLLKVPRHSPNHDLMINVSIDRWISTAQSAE